MRLLGNKVKVRELARKVEIPVVPGSDGAVSLNEAREVAEEIGLPVMLKAEGGGGGRGIYEIYDFDQLDGAFAKASALAQASFGNPRLFVEKLLTSVRHIEIQVIADHHGNVFAFLVDGQGNEYLIEVNTRLQVEHGITECRYGVDLAEEQIAVAFVSQTLRSGRSATPSRYGSIARIHGMVSHPIPG